MQRKHLALLVPIAALALVATGCTSAGSGGGPSASGGEKDTLTLAFETDPYGWDPSSQPGYQNWQAEAVWDTLAFCGADGSLSPAAAEKFEVSNENKTFTAHLREGMKFSDGTPVDADAVQASFEYLMENGGSTADYKGITFDSPDEQTISITWPESQPVMENKICSPKLVPADYLAAGKFDVPVGSGPYVLDTDKTTTGSVYTFKKNEDYWGAKDYPYQNLVIKTFANEAAAVAALKTGQIDAGLVGSADVEQVEGSGFDVLKQQGQTTRLLLTDHLGEVVKPLGDLKVRQAMNMVFDKESMAKNLYQGLAEPTPQVFRKGTAAYIDGMEDPYPFDVDAAKKLMEEAGYADGFDLELPTIEGQNFETLMPYVTEQLAKINIRVTQVPLSGANAITDLLSGTYPVVLWQLGNLGNSAQQIYVESTPEGWWNLEHQPDEYVDSRWAQIATATPEESAKLQKEINQYQVDQAWFAPMVYMGTNFAYDGNKVVIDQVSDQEALTPKLRDFK